MQIPHTSKRRETTRTEPTISAPFVSNLCASIEGADSIVERGLQQFNLNDLDETTTRVPLRRYVALFEWLAFELKRPYLGLEIAQRSGPESLGAISYLFLGSRNLRTALSNFSHYLQVVQDESRQTLEVEGEYAFFHYGISDHRITNRRQDSEYSLSHCWKLIQKFSGNQSQLTMVEFEHERPAVGEGPYRRVFGAPVLFGRASNRLRFRTDELHRQSKSGDPHLFPILEAHMQEAVKRAAQVESFCDQVRSLVTPGALQDGIRAKAIAAQLGISPATLHRRLRHEKTSFKSLTDAAGKSLATLLIAQKAVPIAVIARRLGYAETACLTRAFYRWFGMSPREYRYSLARKV